jgi:Putative zinc-finger/FecR protein
MFARHFRYAASAYCHGELSPTDSRQVAEHLMICRRCHADFAEVRLGVKFAEHLPRIAAPDSLWSELEPLVAARRLEALRPRETVGHFRLWRPEFAVAAGVLVMVMGLILLWVIRREAAPFWEVARLDGTPLIGSSRINDSGRLAVGQWLVTDAASRARIAVASIGEVEIDPNTRVRLVETGPTEHRLELARGRLSARIWAPPRIFFVNTPAGVAEDLGCAYIMTVDDHGNGKLRVTHGWVSFQAQGRESKVPAGAACVTRPGTGAGTPFFEDASASFRDALEEVDFGPPGVNATEALHSVLAEARSRDTLTLWHLLARVEPKERELVYDRLVAFAPPPDGVSREGVLRLDQGMLTLWRERLEANWSDQSLPAIRKVWNRFWTSTVGRVKSLEGKR